MPKSKREEKAEEGEYEFKLPDFDEEAFVRKEIQTSRASFYTLGLGFLAGFLSLGLFAAGLDWKWGWLPILAAMGALAPLLRRAGFGDDIVAPKALIGSYFMLFFTGFAIWLFGVEFL